MYVTIAFSACLSLAETARADDPARFAAVKAWEGDYTIFIEGGFAHAGSEGEGDSTLTYSTNLTLLHRFTGSARLDKKEQEQRRFIWRGSARGVTDVTMRHTWRYVRRQGDHVSRETGGDTCGGGGPIADPDAGLLQIDTEQGTYKIFLEGGVTAATLTHRVETVATDSPRREERYAQELPQHVGSIGVGMGPVYPATLAPVMGGFPWVEPTDPEALARESLRDAMSDGRRLPETGFVLEGRATVPLKVPVSAPTTERFAPGVGTLTVRWRFYPAGMAPPKALLTRVDRAWLPTREEGKDEVEASVTWENSGTPAAVELTLFDVSNEKGECLNSVAVGTEPDLEFVPQPGVFTIEPAGDHAWRATVREQEIVGDTVRIKIRSKDYGAFAKLRARALLAGRWIDAEVVGGPSGDVTTVPIDDDGNRVADDWEERNGGVRPKEWDAEQTDGNSNDGDGFSHYEEFRGLYRQAGDHTRLSPTEKDLVVENRIREAAKLGLAKFEQATAAKVVELEPGMLRADRVANANGGTAHSGDQHGLVLERDGKTLEAGRPPDLGEAVPGGAPKASPKDCEKVVIFGPLVDDPANPIWTSYERPRGPEFLSLTIAHEIGHACGLLHHGDRDEGFGGTIEARHTDITVYDANNTPITTRPLSIDEDKVGTPGGKQSGDLACIMAYPQFYSWAMHQKNEQRSYWYVPLIEVGHSLCTSKAGTGINAGRKYFGDAQHGNCRARLKIKDF